MLGTVQAVYENILKLKPTPLEVRLLAAAAFRARDKAAAEILSLVEWHRDGVKDWDAEDRRKLRFARQEVRAYDCAAAAEGEAVMAKETRIKGMDGALLEARVADKFDPPPTAFRMRVRFGGGQVAIVYLAHAGAIALRKVLDKAIARKGRR